MQRSTWRTGAKRALAPVGLILHVATLVLYVPSGLVAPRSGVMLLYVAWLAILALGLRWRQRHPFRVLALPLVSVATWAVVVTVGDARFGWTG